MQMFNTGYGFKTLKINLMHNVYTCKISVKNTEKFPNIAGVTTTITKSGKLLLSYVTTDVMEHSRMQKDIMLFLEQHAMSKVKSKYAWLHPEDYAMSAEDAAELKDIELAL